jgi:hypothetical protein
MKRMYGYFSRDENRVELIDFKESRKLHLIDRNKFEIQCGDYQTFLDCQYVLQQWEEAHTVLLTYSCLNSDVLHIVKQYDIQEVIHPHFEIAYMEEAQHRPKTCFDHASSQYRWEWLDHEVLDDTNKKDTSQDDPTQRRTLLAVCWMFPFKKCKFLSLADNEWSYVFLEHLSYSPLQLQRKVYDVRVDLKTLHKPKSHGRKITWTLTSQTGLTLFQVTLSPTAKYSFSLPACGFVLKTLETILFGTCLGRYHRNSSVRESLCDFLMDLGDGINHQSLLRAYSNIDD